MSPEEIEGHITRILWGGQYIRADRLDNSSVLLILNPPTLKDKNFIEFIYEDALITATSMGLFTRFYLAKELKERQIWGDKDNENIKVLEESLGEYNSELEDAKEQPRQRKRLEKIISAIKGTLSAEKERRDSVFRNSAEGYAEGIRNSAVVFCCASNEDETRVWETWDDFLLETDNILIYSVIKKLNESKPINTSQIREIARSNSWRFRWSGAKSIGNLFGKAVRELDVEQQSLLYWSQIYDSVYDAYEKPDDDIINDDEALDKWFKDQDKKEKSKKATTTGKINKSLQLSDKMRRHGEIFIMANPEINPNAPTTQEIEELNSSIVRKFKRKETEAVQKAGQINEKLLRGRKNHIARKMINSKAAVFKSNSMGQARGGRAAQQIYPGEAIG